VYVLSFTEFFEFTVTSLFLNKEARLSLQLALHFCFGLSIRTERLRTIKRKHMRSMVHPLLTNWKLKELCAAALRR